MYNCRALRFKKFVQSVSAVDKSGDKSRKKERLKKMSSEILIYLLVSLLSATAQNVESGNSTVEEATSSSSPSSSLPVQLKSNSKSEVHEQNFATQTIAFWKKGFSLPQIKRARELGAPSFSIFDQKSTPPVISEIDRGSTTEMQSDHSKYQNATHEE
ncbi:unnamed protein product [Onchocerca flexuosa]|uniref:DUF4148 domain-containing protein n=1 Tax=Onchocerca flexuosa TaxID=387005 RepID=A0A183H1Z5_9BILA|nr:unnamed protein product [Onchocerca flexuosa]